MRMDRVRGPDAATLLVRALRAHAADAAVALAVRSIASRPWASATFVGMQHRAVVLAPPGPALAAWIAALPAVEWTLRGHLVADLVVEDAAASEGDAGYILSILTIAAD